jgi:hypothetical protein
MKKPLFISSLLLGALALTLAATPAMAQTDAQPPSSPPPTAVVVSSPSGGGAGLGFGAVAWLSTLAGAQVVYDQTMFHIEGTLSYLHTSPPGMAPSGSTFQFGAGGWYHLFRGVNSDFSIGGGAGLNYASAAGASTTTFDLEPGAEARVFLTPNFALSGRVGFAITFGDNNAPTNIGLGGQTTGSTAGFGFTYFIR